MPYMSSPTGLSTGIGTVVVSCKACPTPESLALSHPFQSSRVTFPASFKGQYFLPAGPLSTGVQQGPRPHPGQPLISSGLGWQKRRLRPLLPNFVVPPHPQHTRPKAAVTHLQNQAVKVRGQES